MYRVFTTLFICSTLMVGCAGFKSAPQFGVVHAVPTGTNPKCDPASDLMEVRNCVVQLKYAYASHAADLDAGRTRSGGALIGLAAIGAGNELFKQSRDITRTSGLLGGIISSTHAYAPPATLAKVLQSGKSQLECALIKSDELKAQLAAATPKYGQMHSSYVSAEDEIAVAKANAASPKEISRLEVALETMEHVCNATTAAALMKKAVPTSTSTTPPSEAETMEVDEPAIARQLYATAVSISDQVTEKYRGSYGDTTNATKQIDDALAKVQAALAQRDAMKGAAKAVDAAAEELAPGVACNDGKPATGAKVSTEAKTACAAKGNADVVVNAAEDAAKIALTAASLSACAGVK